MDLFTEHEVQVQWAIFFFYSLYICTAECYIFFSYSSISACQTETLQTYEEIIFLFIIL